jgi:hypothetical protein
MAVGDILAVRIAGDTTHNGWTAEIDIQSLSTGGSYAFGLTSAASSLSSAKIAFTVTSHGYDATGTATTTTRTVYGTHAVRKPTPNNAQMDEAVVSTTLTVKVSLSDYIYSTDTATVNILSGFYTQGTANNAASGVTVTINSTRAYPGCIGRWAWPAFETVTGDFLLEAVCFNRFAKNGKPLAAVVFTVTDQHSHTVNVTVNDMTVSTRTGDQNKVLVYAATIPVSTLTQGDVLTCNFKAYPWIGDSGSTLDSNSGVTPPDERLTPLLLVNDKSGTYGAAFACVSPTGNDTTGTTYSTQAAAEAGNAYLTIGKAVQGIKAFNNTTYTRNNPGGGVIVLKAGSYSYPGTQPASDQGAMDTWVTIQPASGVSRASAIINNGTNQDMATQKVKFSGITIDTSANTPVATIVGRSTSRPTTVDVVWIDNCVINMPNDTAPIYTWTLAYATRNSVTAIGGPGGFLAFSTTPCPYGLIRGNSAPSTSATAGIAGHMYCCIGNKNIVVGGAGNGWIEPGDTSGQQITDNAIYAFNTAYNINVQPIQAYTSGTTWAKGAAFVQNVVEKVTDADPLAQIAADGTTATPIDNVIIWHNTFVGQRLNLAYNETGTTALFRTNWSIRHNLLFNWNIKSDLFGTPSANRIGNWAQLYRVGDAGDQLQGYTGVYFPPDCDGLYTLSSPATNAFVSDKSFQTGDALGNGDYHLQSTSSFRVIIPSGAAVLPYDLEGTARDNSGAGAIGAYESLIAVSRSLISAYEIWYQTGPAYDSGAYDNVIYYTGSIVNVSRALTTAYEILSGLSQSKASPWESLGYQSNARTSRFEFLSAVSQSRTANDELLLGVLRGLASSYALLAGVSKASAENFEAIGITSRSLASAYEDLRSLLQSGTSSYELLTKAIKPLTTAYEELIGVSQSKATPYEDLAGITRSLSSSYEELVTLLQARLENYDFLSSASRSGLENFELLSRTSATKTSAYELLLGVQRGLVQSYEALLGQQRSLAASWESLGLLGVTRQAVSNYEAAGKVFSSGLANYESLIALLNMRIAAYEMLRGAQAAKDSNRESLSAAVAARTSSFASVVVLNKAVSSMYELLHSVQLLVGTDWEAKGSGLATSLLIQNLSVIAAILIGDLQASSEVTSPTLSATPAIVITELTSSPGD